MHCYSVASDIQWVNMDEEASLKYELCPYPVSLFDDSGTIRKPDKQELAKAIRRLSETDAIVEKA